MKAVQKIVNRLDAWQQSHRLSAFLYAVIKKYGEDEAGYQAALLAYYGFLSLFPLLLVLTTVAGLIGNHHPGFQADIIKSMTNYFPVLGNQLSNHVHSLHKSGLALVIGITLTLYGARGVADVFRHGVNHIWQVPKEQRDGFPKALIKSLELIIVGGLGLLLASILAGFAAGVGHGFAFRLLSILVNIFILIWLFSFMLNASLPSHVSIKKILPGAASAAIGLVILQALGSYLLVRELKNLDALYSNFAIALGLLFWIYLQAQVLYYAVEIAAVKAHNVWPRSLTGDLTTADKKSYSRLAKKEQVVAEEHITARFHDKDES